MISRVISKEMIRLKAPAQSWQDAVRAGGDALVEAGCALPSYVDAMVESITETGPYIVVAPGIAIPHAKPECGALRTGVSIVTLKDPVWFGSEDNDPVSYVFCLAAADASGHLDLMQSFVELLERPDFYTALDLAASAEDAILYLRNFDSRGGE